MKTSTSLFTLILIGLLFCVPGSAFPPVEPCGNIASSTLSYSASSSSISPATELKLKALADQMRAEPSCKVVVMGSAGGSKFDQELSWLRVYGVIEYMSDNLNIDRNRFIFKMEGAAANQVICRGAYEGEDGPSTVTEPHPALRP